MWAEASGGPEGDEEEVSRLESAECTPLSVPGTAPAAAVHMSLPTAAQLRGFIVGFWTNLKNSGLLLP